MSLARSYCLPESSAARTTCPSLKANCHPVKSMKPAASSSGQNRERLPSATNCLHWSGPLSAPPDFENSPALNQKLNRPGTPVVAHECLDRYWEPSPEQ